MTALGVLVRSWLTEYIPGGVSSWTKDIYTEPFSVASGSTDLDDFFTPSVPSVMNVAFLE